MKKTILITGSTDGIGKLVAMDFAKDGHTVYVHGRNSEKVASLIIDLKQKTGNQNIDGFVADFSDLDAVKKMAVQINEKLDKLDILINNAGVFVSPDSKNNEGLDVRYVVNYFAPYILTKMLIPILEKGDGARIINLSSAAQSSVSYEAFKGQQEIPVNATYAQSKLALTMWSFKLAEQLKDITVIAVNPGSLLNTKMAQEAYGQAWSQADKGSNILYDLALSPKHDEMTGKYFDNDSGAYARAHADAYNPEAIEMLINETENLIS